MWLGWTRVGPSVIDTGSIHAGLVRLQAWEKRLQSINTIHCCITHFTLPCVRLTFLSFPLALLCPHHRRRHTNRAPEDILAFSTEAVNSVVEAYCPIIKKHMNDPFTEQEKQWQQIRRGR